MVISVSRRIISGWSVIFRPSIHRLPDFIARVVQIPVEFAAGLLRALFCVMQRLAAILPELFGAATRVLPGLASPFTGVILIGSGACPQTCCEEDNHCISHGGSCANYLPGEPSARGYVRKVVCEKKLLCKKKPAGWNYTGGQGDSGRVTSGMKNFWTAVARSYRFIARRLLIDSSPGQ